MGTEEQPQDPATPVDEDPEVISANKAKRVAEARKVAADAATAAADAEKAATEAEQAAETARRTAANADRDAAMADQKAKAENDKEIAEARSTAMKAWLPEPKTQPLEGTVDVGDGTGSVGRVAALSLLSDAARQIAIGVAKAKPKRVLVVDKVDLAASDWSHALVNSQLTPLTAAARRLKLALGGAGATPGPAGRSPRGLEVLGAAATVVPALVGAAADVAGFFRSNYTVAKVDITATSTPLVAAVASELITKDITCYVDGLALFRDQAGTLAAFGELLDLRWSLLDARIRASQTALQRAKDEVVKAQAAIDAAKDQPANLVNARAELSTAQDHVASVQGLIDATSKLEELIDTFTTSVTTIAAEATLPPLGQAAVRDVVHDQKHPVHILALSIDEVGSDGVTRRRLFRAPTTTYVGATHVSALLLAPGGGVAMSTTYAGTGTARVKLSSGKVTTRSKPMDEWQAFPRSRTTKAAGATIADPPRPPLPAAAPPAVGAPVEPGAARARWTLMVFMAGMNNLAQEADADIAEIVAGNPGGDVEVVVFVKQPTGSRRFRIGGDVEELGDVDSGDPNTVVDFVRWATVVAPAERYALVLWNHGSGWEPWAYDVDAPVAVRPIRAAGGMRKVNGSLFPGALAHAVPDVEARQRAILTDDGTAHAVDTIELGRVTAAINEHLERNLDVLAMDACLMSNLEVASQVRDDVDVIVASEELEPGTGWHYTDLLGRMRAHEQDLTAEAFGSLAVESYLAGYVGYPKDVTLCAIKAVGATGVAEVVEQLASALRATLPDGRTLITDCLKQSRRFDGHLVDLGHLCKNLINTTTGAADNTAERQVGEAAQRVRATLASGAGYVLAEGHAGPTATEVTGVTIYLPASTDPLADTYGGLRFSEETGWDELLHQYQDA